MNEINKVRKHEQHKEPHTHIQQQLNTEKET